MRKMIEIKDLHKTYNYKKSNAYEALKGVSLEVEEGELVAIIGKSGAGKSTLMHIIGCIDDFESGSYMKFTSDELTILIIDSAIKTINRIIIPPIF